MSETVQPGMVLEGYEFLDRIFQEGHRSCFRVRSQKYDRIFVAKVALVLGDDVDSVWRVFDSEIRALTRLCHPNIIKLYSHFRYLTSFILILEECPNGSLTDYIAKNGPLEGPVLHRIVRDLGSAMNHAWSKGVQHRDFSPDNVLFDESGRVKLVNFGASNVSKESRVARCEKSDCSDICAAPEILMGKKHHPVRADIWAFGITVLWMLRGGQPWVGLDRQMMIRTATNVECYIPKGMEPVIKEMLLGMLVVTAKRRVFPSDERLSTLVVEPVDKTRQQGLIVAQGTRRTMMGMAARVKTLKPGPLKGGMSMRFMPRITQSKGPPVISVSNKQLPILGPDGNATTRRETVTEGDWSSFKQSLSIGQDEGVTSCRSADDPDALMQPSGIDGVRKYRRSSCVGTFAPSGDCL